MITENNIKRLDDLIKKYAMQDYLRANPKKKDGRLKYKTYHPYSLSSETNEAREMYALARKKDITKEEEETVKAYLLKHKLIMED